MSVVCFWSAPCANALSAATAQDPPERVGQVVATLQKLHHSAPFDAHVEVVEATASADLRWIHTAHSAAYVRALRAADASAWEASAHAAGAVCAAVDRVLECEGVRAFCAVRPAGLDAGRDGPMEEGAHALLNHVAVGAKYALLRHGLERVAVVQLHMRPGRGLEDIVGGDDNFLVVRVFVGQESDGSESAPSNVLRLPLDANKQRSAAQFRSDVAPGIAQRLRAFDPQLVLLSVGFDGLKNDPTALAALTERDYYAVAAQACAVADVCCAGRVVSVLEGGSGSALVHAVEAHVLALATPPALLAELSDAASQSRWTRAQLRTHVKAAMEGERELGAGERTVRVERKRDRATASQDGFFDADELSDGRLSDEKRPRTEDEDLDEPQQQQQLLPPLQQPPQTPQPALNHPNGPLPNQGRFGDDDDAEEASLAHPHHDLRQVHALAHSPRAEMEREEEEEEEEEEAAEEGLRDVDEEDIEVDVMDDGDDVLVADDEGGAPGRRDDEGEDSQEGTARDGPDLQLDLEMSERSFTEAVEQPKHRTMVGDTDADGYTKPTAPVAVAPAAPPSVRPAATVAAPVTPSPAALHALAPIATELDMDEINALIGEELGDL